MSCVCHAFACGHCCLVLWSPAGKGLTSWLFCVMFNCVFVAFPCGILGQMWYLIVSIPVLCRLYYYIHSQLGKWLFSSGVVKFYNWTRHVIAGQCSEISFLHRTETEAMRYMISPILPENVPTCRITSEFLIRPAYP